MLIAIRARSNNPEDKALREKLERVVAMGGSTEAQLIRDGVGLYLDMMEEKLKSMPVSRARVEIAASMGVSL